MKKSANARAEWPSALMAMFPNPLSMSLCLAPQRVVPARLPAPDTQGIRSWHVKCAPAPLLRAYVEHYWITRWDRRGQPPRLAAMLADPCVHLQITNGHAEIVGVLRGVLRIRIEETGCVVGIKFHPGGFHPIARRPIDLWTDRRADAAEVFPSAGDSLRAAWNDAATCTASAMDGARIGAQLDAILETAQPSHDVVADEVATLVALIARDASVRRVSDLVRASGRSERTLERIFARYAGVSPAWVIKRYRLQAAAARLTTTPPADVRAVACEFGYADQAHFIREFRKTIGVTPGEYVRRG